MFASTRSCASLFSLFFGALLSFALPTLLHGQSIENLSSDGSDIYEQHLLLLNPAIAFSSGKLVSIGVIRESHRASVTASPQGNTQKWNFDNNGNGIFGGFLIPIGGASLGIRYAEMRDELIGKTDQQTREFEESYLTKVWSFRFILDLTSSIRAGFQYLTKRVENDVYGSFNINADDKTNYRGSLNGFRLGAMYEGSKFSVAAYTAPPQRGKSEIEGEQKIITAPGTAGLDAAFRSGREFDIGLGMTRWYYKRDDRWEGSTSPNDQRDMSLLGLHPQQFYFETLGLRFSSRYRLKNDVYVVASISQIKGVFLSNPDLIPGDDRDQEEDASRLTYKLAVNFRKPRFSLDVGIYFDQLDADNFNDNSRRLGIGSFADFERRAQSTQIKFTLFN